jgi:Ferritin-like domain
MGRPSTRVTRATLLMQGACAAGVGVVGIPALVGAAQSAEQDARVLELLLMVEYAESAFYAEALQRGGLKGELRAFAQQVSEHEKAHLSVLQGVVKDARAEPEHDFGDATRSGDAFADAAARLEDLAVEACKGQAPRLQSKQVLAAALGIHTVEARHAAWMRYLNSIEPAASAFDNPRPKQEIDRIVRATGFVTQKPRMTARRRPRYAG